MRNILILLVWIGAIGILSCTKNEVNLDANDEMNGDSVKNSTISETIFIGSDDNYFYAIDPASGKIKWEYNAGDEILTNPVIYEGLVYFGCKNGIIFALDISSGKQRWIYRVDYDQAIYTGPIVKNGVVYAGAKDFLCALDAKNGSLKWRYYSKYVLGDIIKINGDILYVSFSDTMNAIDISTGKPIWTFISGNSIVTGSAVSGGYLYFMDYSGVMYALDASLGDLKWKYETNFGGFHNTTPLVADEVLYFSIPNRDQLFALNSKTGSKIWNLDNIDFTDPHSDSSPSIYGNTLFVAGSNLYAINAKSGVLEWQVYIKGTNVSPTFAGNKVYIANWYSEFYCIDVNTKKIAWTFNSKTRGFHTSACVLMKDGNVKYPSTSGMVQ